MSNQGSTDKTDRDQNDPINNPPDIERSQVDAITSIDADRYDDDEEQDKVKNQQLLSQFLSMQDGIVPGDILDKENTALHQYSNIPDEMMTRAMGNNLLNCNVNKDHHSSSSQHNDQDQVLDDNAINAINQVINDIDQGKYQATSLNSQLANYLLTAAEYSNLTLVQKLLDRCPSLIHVTDSDG